VDVDVAGVAAVAVEPGELDPADVAAARLMVVIHPQKQVMRVDEV
jgi:hypothetical protein